MNSTNFPEYPYVAIAPGRVNLLGEHVDYNDGPVLPAAIDRTVKVYFRPRKDNQVRLVAQSLGNLTASFTLDNLLEKRNNIPGWAHYPAGVAWVLQDMGIPTGGVDAVAVSDLPVGSGLSSSAAVEMAFAALWNYLSGSKADTVSLVKAAQRAENEYVGVNCGIMDQFACGMGKAGHAIFLDTRTLDWQTVPLPHGTIIVIADSGIRRSLHNSAYNERRASCELALNICKKHLPHICALRDVSSLEYQKIRHQIPAPANIRAQHVVDECERVDQAIPLLRTGDAVGFGKLMTTCHDSLRDLYEVSIPELDHLVKIATRTEGCFGARLTGAGFGGCTVNLVAESYVEEFSKILETGYLAATGRSASVFPCKPSDGVRVFPNQ
jgi:galactokinase